MELYLTLEPIKKVSTLIKKEKITNTYGALRLVVVVAHTGLGVRDGVW